MPSLPKIPIPLTSKDSAGNPQVASNANNKKWCFFIKAPVNTFQHDWQLSPQCINYATLAAIFTNSVSGKKKVLTSSGKGIFTFYISLGRFLCFVLFCFVFQGKSNSVSSCYSCVSFSGRRTREPPFL